MFDDLFTPVFSNVNPYAVVVVLLVLSLIQFFQVRRANSRVEKLKALCTDTFKKATKAVVSTSLVAATEVAKAASQAEVAEDRADAAEARADDAETRLYEAEARADEARVIADEALVRAGAAEYRATQAETALHEIDDEGDQGEEVEESTAVGTDTTQAAGGVFFENTPFRTQSLIDELLQGHFHSTRPTGRHYALDLPYGRALSERFFEGPTTSIVEKFSIENIKQALGGDISGIEKALGAEPGTVSFEVFSRKSGKALSAAERETVAKNLSEEVVAPTVDLPEGFTHVPRRRPIDNDLEL